MRRVIAFLVVVVCTVSVGFAAPIYIGDDAAQGQAVTDLGTPDGAGAPVAGAITYAFDTDSKLILAGDPLNWKITEVNFWDDGISGSTVTPFVALYNGLGVATGANFNVISVGDPIASSPGLNNASFLVGGVNPTISVNVGDELVAGFHQDGRIIPFGGGPGGDYLDEGFEIPVTPPGGALTENAQWSNLGRTYAFNVGLEEVAVPEPASLIVWLPALLALGWFTWRRMRK